MAAYAAPEDYDRRARVRDAWADSQKYDLGEFTILDSGYWSFYRDQGWIPLDSYERTEANFRVMLEEWRVVTSSCR